MLRRYCLTEKDMLFIFSASGKNAVPVEMAESAKALGIRTVGVSSSAYFDHGASLHKKVDIAIDCKVPHGDASLKVGEAGMGALSTSAACFILNSCLIEGARIALAEGKKPPVFLSGNIEGGKEFNLALEEAYLGRVKHL